MTPCASDRDDLLELDAVQADLLSVIERVETISDERAALEEHLAAILEIKEPAEAPKARVVQMDCPITGNLIDSKIYTAHIEVQFEKVQSMLIDPTQASI